MTMSAVMKVHVKLESSQPGFTAVLKLYDRRFGTTLLRRMLNPTSLEYEAYPHTTTIEAAYCDFIRRGNLSTFLHDYEQETRAQLLAEPAWSFLDGSPEGTAKYEAVTWHMCQEHFDRETRAYTKLSELQGKIIPRLFAHVRLSVPQEKIVPCPPDLLEQPQMRQYFEVKGILMELVDGYELVKLHMSPLAPSDPERWQDIIQTAMDGAHEINHQGVRMSESSMYNVMVDKESHRPFIVDFAQCRFIEEMYEKDEGKSSSDEEAQDGEPSGGDAAYGSDHQGSQSWDEEIRRLIDWDPDPEIRYWYSVRTWDNPGTIGDVMRGRLMREKGVSITPRWTDYDAIIAAIRREREQDGLLEGSERGL